MSETSRRIAFLIPFYKDGGAERVLFAVAREAIKRGVSVDIISCQDSQLLRDNAPIDATLHTLNTHSLLAPLKLKKIIIGQGIESITSTLISTNFINIITKQIFRLNYRAILREANCLPQHFAFRSPLNRFLSRLIVRYSYPKATSVISVSDEARVNMQKLLGQKTNNVAHIPNPIDFEKIDRLKKEHCDHPWLANKTTPIILAAGRLKPQKGFDILLHAFAKLKNDARLIILGEGQERDKLQAIAQSLSIIDKIDFAGFASNPYPYFAKADLFTLSSHHEGMPNVLLDAMACGCNIVSTDCPSGPKELLKQGDYGALVPAGNIEKLAQAMDEALTNPQDTSKRLDYLQQFDIRHITDLYLKVALHV